MRASTSILYLTCLAVALQIKNVTCSAKTKIIGGNHVDIVHRPFMLSLHNSHGFVCGASILSRKWGITALHCLTSERTTDYYVRAGSNHPDRGGSVHELKTVHVYNDTTFLYWFSIMFSHDIALFEVQPQFRFTNTVQAVRLPGEFSVAPRVLYVCGWGVTNLRSSVRMSNILMGVHVRHRPYEICIEETPEYKFLVQKEHHLCYGAPGKDSCSGDSGGPLASRNTIYGVVSFGTKCAVVSGVYESVSYYRRWIKQVTDL
ncbi:trypsin 3A1 isoform X1 [Andrena cerasifolii]|uniref:trypsin 3A1 isoform X1 n=2 Tax=Andrena cerasifolii TaxID=2819439 RepID=UPI0040380691